MEYIEFKTEYKELTGKELTQSDIAKEIDIFIDKINSLDAVSSFDREIVDEILVSIKRSFYGVQISANIKKLSKAVDILTKTASLDTISKEDAGLCNFYAGVIQKSVDDVKSAKDKMAWKKGANRESWKK